MNMNLTRIAKLAGVSVSTDAVRLEPFETMPIEFG